MICCIKNLIHLDKFPVSCLISSYDLNCLFSSIELTLYDLNLRFEFVIVFEVSISWSCSWKGGKWAYSVSSYSSLTNTSEFLKNYNYINN